jgi:hypothetical protein
MVISIKNKNLLFDSFSLPFLKGHFFEQDAQHITKSGFFPVCRFGLECGTRLGNVMNMPAGLSCPSAKISIVVE